MVEIINFINFFSKLGCMYRSFYNNHGVIWFTKQECTFIMPKHGLCLAKTIFFIIWAYWVV